MPRPMSEYLKEDIECESLLECFHGLGSLDREVFGVLTAADRPFTVDEVAERVERERSTAYRSLSRLVEAGFCHKEQVNDAGRRYYHVFEPAPAEGVSRQLQRMRNDRYATMGALVGEFEEKYGEGTQRFVGHRTVSAHGTIIPVRAAPPAMTYVVVVGAYGSAGVAAAERLAKAPDVQLTMVDDGDPGGGLCILRGCMPSKEVLSAAEHRFAARKDGRLDGPLPDVDLESVVATKDEHTSNFAAHRRAAVENLAERENVELLRDTARFVDDRRIEMGDRTLEPDYVVLATGSSVNVPDLPGIEDVAFLTSADVLDATEFGDSGVVMGFGYVGMELVPYLAEAGVSLTVVEHDARPLDQADAPFGDALLSYYRENFDVEVLTHTDERRVEPTADGGVRMYVEGPDGERTVEADDLYLFTGRRPTLDRLGLEATALDPKPGWVEPTMQAADDERVFVAGDANGIEPILHVAKEQGFLTADNVLAHRDGEPLEPYENVHHHVVFSGLGVLPFARVGHSAASANEAGLDHLVVTREASSDGVFTTKNVPEGLARLVVGTDGTVLGYQGLHYHADAMAKTMQVVVEMELDVREIPDRAYHPTTPEILDGLFREASDALVDRARGPT